MDSTTNNNMPGLTLQQLQGMGAKPVQPKGMTLQELQSQGATPTSDSTMPTSDPTHKSFLQKVASVSKGIGNAFTSSEQTLGKGLSTVGSNGIQKDLNQQSQEKGTQIQALTEALHNQTDPVKRQHLIQGLKNLGATPDLTAGDINPAYNLSNGQVLGAAAGTALDVASFGSYGKEASLAENTGKLTKNAKVLNPIAEQITKKTLTQTLADIGTRAVKRAAIGGVTGYGYDISNNLQAGKVGKEAFKPGTGTIAGAVVPLAIGGIEATKAITKETAPRYINSLVKPKQADFAYGKNPGRTVSEMGITGNNLEDFGNNISQAKQGVGQQIGAIYSSPENAAKTVNLNPEIVQIDTAMRDAAKGGKNNQGIVTTLQNLKDALLYDHKIDTNGNIIRVGDTPIDYSNANLQQGFDLKQKVADATQFTGRPSDDKTVNATLKKIYGGISEQLTTAVKDTNPEIGKLNQQYGDLTSAEIAVKNRDKIVQRSNLISIKSGGAGAAATIAALAVGTATLPATLVGVAGATLEKALETTAVKTRIAAWLGSESPETIAKVLDQNPKIKTVLLRALPKFASKIGK